MSSKHEVSRSIEPRERLRVRVFVDARAFPTQRLPNLLFRGEPQAAVWPHKTGGTTRRNNKHAFCARARSETPCSGHPNKTNTARPRVAIVIQPASSQFRQAGPSGHKARANHGRAGGQPPKGQERRGREGRGARGTATHPLTARRMTPMTMIAWPMLLGG